ncbi:MAG: winged helix DNA-binding domain-containing protein [Woeseia sp.]
MKGSSLDIALLRLRNQCLAGTPFESPADVVHWLGAVQAQDYLGALWAIGLRLPHATEADVEQAIRAKAIVRTWPQRGTLHFVASRDVRWMLSLLTPRMIAGSSGRYRQLELSEVDFSRARDLFVQALQGGNQLTRPEMYRVLELGKIATTGQRGIHILGHLAQSGLICFGPRRGKQHTFTLLEEWLPPAGSMPRDEALAELTRRYFASHGPATLRDFAWWSGLTAQDARAGIDSTRSQLVQHVIDGTTYWFSDASYSGKKTKAATHLLPAFDEYTVGYKDRSAILDPQFASRLNAGGGMLRPVSVVDARVVGTWKRSFKKNAVVVTAAPFIPHPGATRTLSAAAKRYGNFLQMPVSLTMEG